MQSFSVLDFLFQLGFIGSGGSLSTCYPGRIWIWKGWFLMGGKLGVPGEKPLQEKERTNNKLYPHMASMSGFEPRPHWWEASAPTTVPPP